MLNIIMGTYLLRHLSQHISAFYVGRGFDSDNVNGNNVEKNTNSK